MNHTTLYTLQFSVDKVVIGQHKEDMEYMIRKLYEEYEKWVIWGVKCK